MPTIEELSTNYSNRSTSIMVGSLLGDTVASLDILLSHVKEDNEAIAAVADACQTIKHATLWMCDNLPETAPMTDANELADRILYKALQQLGGH